MPDSLAAALAELQANPPKIAKRARAQYGNYADLPAVTKALVPELVRLELLWQTWPDTEEDGSMVLRWCLTHLPTDQKIHGRYPIHATNPQQIGSEITYARRYALVTVTGVTPAGDDDEGQAASQAPQGAPGRQPRAQGAQHPREAYRGAEARTRVTGPDHERLRYGTVEATPDDHPAERFSTAPPVDDMWTDQLPGNFDIGIPEDRPGSIDDRQMKLLQIAFKDAGVTDRDVRLGMASDMIGRQVLTAKQLSRLEAEHIIKTLKEQKQ